MAGMLSLARRGRPSLTMERGRGDRASTVSFPGTGGAEGDDDADLEEGGDAGVLGVASPQDSREAPTASAATAVRSTRRPTASQ